MASVKDWSQHGESMVLHYLFNQQIDPQSKVAVEFGAGDGYRFSNIRMLMEDGWTGIQWDTETWTTAENINDLFAEKGVPEDVDLVSIDLDGNDYWVWQALRWEPSVVIIEYNSAFPHGESVAMAYDPDHRWDQTADYSASFDAYLDLAADKGYYFHHEIAHANLIFIHERWSGVHSQDPRTVKLPYQRWGMPTKPFIAVPVSTATSR